MPATKLNLPWWATRTPFPTIRIGPRPQTSPNATANSTGVARATRKDSLPPHYGSRKRRVVTTKKPLALIFTADEEIGLRGAKQLAQAKPLRVRYSIVGEPTSLKPIRAGKGYSLAEVIVKGREAHSAYPALGASAVFRAARLINRLESIAVQLKQDQHAAFDPPYTTLNIGLIHGGSAKNVLAGECRFTLEWRPIPTQSSDHVLNLFKAAIQEETQADPDFKCEVDASRADARIRDCARFAFD